LVVLAGDWHLDVWWKSKLRRRSKATAVRNETIAVLSCESRERITERTGVAGTVYGMVSAFQLTEIVGSRTDGAGELSLFNLIRFVEVV